MKAIQVSNLHCKYTEMRPWVPNAIAHNVFLHGFRTHDRCIVYLNDSTG